MASDASIKNVEQVRQFGKNLSIASDNLVGLFSKLNSQMHMVCDEWNDDQNRKFMVDFERRCQEIQQLSNEMRNYSNFIAKACEIADQYKSLRY